MPTKIIPCNNFQGNHKTNNLGVQSSPKRECLTDFAVQQKLHNTVKQQYSKKIQKKENICVLQIAAHGHEFKQTPRDGEGQGSLACCSPWSCRELETT